MTKDINNYIKIRTTLLEKGVNLEVLSSMLPIRVSIVNF